METDTDVKPRDANMTSSQTSEDYKDLQITTTWKTTGCETAIKRC